jgi:hypothetical protein
MREISFASLAGLMCQDDPRGQDILLRDVRLDGPGHHRVDDLVRQARGFFGGRGGNGCQGRSAAFFTKPGWKGCGSSCWIKRLLSPIAVMC